MRDVPPRAVSEAAGGYHVAALDPRNKVSIRSELRGRDRVGDQWSILVDGLEAKRRVVAEGVAQKVRAGRQVTPSPFGVERYRDRAIRCQILYNRPIVRQGHCASIMVISRRN